MAGRLGLTAIHPVISAGNDLAPLPSRAAVGEPVTIEATVFREGHDAVAASVILRNPKGKAVAAGAELNRMHPLGGGTDRWRTEVIATSPGMWTYQVEAWSDPLATWYHAIEVKVDAGQNAEELANDLELGARLFEKVAELARTKAEAKLAHAAVKDLRREDVDVPLRITRSLTREVRDLAYRYPVRELITAGPKYEIWVDRTRALYGAWYEFFPRSIGAELAGDPHDPARPARHGTFADATKHLDYVRDMGFDVVYLPPIHPIGKINRKGPNNTLNAKPTDTGSPWAIGSAEGGHDAIHPELGDERDFAAFVTRARELNMEVALDLALQCAPDHPWVSSHPEWFTTLPDGTIAYAENPPKKYQDIYPLNFDNDPKGLYAESLRVTMLWVERGVRIFRVDNPHTKPLDFWQWLIAAVKKKYPDVLFLAEAFTRPAMMHELAKVGFTQSYTYFTWRNTAWELQQYGEELVAGSDYMRPNFFPNTPDILNEFLQHSGRPGFAIRAVLASMMSPTYGVYSGFELFEGTAVRPGSEEYLDSEKYQLRPRDYYGAIDRGDSLAPMLTRLNEIRRAHPSLHQLRNLRFHASENDGVIIFSKRDERSGDTILVVCSMDPHNVREGWVHLRLDWLGVDWFAGFTASDLLSGANYQWGEHNFVRLTPDQPAHIFAVHPLS
ncbi:alpha-1,4-glucan--maltose-1-phosphate maltosyltransferase [Jatrophihabitans telluris]|uniref:Alpha-1,4-glucan:maltose-1-phosphate maltosyltransferase n=1 Tax=Jatrophihabitans telluris TaxID=2038343 RepID=A0ABY4R3N4_9ACTN|nr:alpha-1,4-glucan--maltose-1-phosphate maltosyltransferase [Jatrophihabitans telluris]UQX89907.1 alpha-1,4-glucan--maltose-1-phosphate maltosyltransferase [Jatrophihabitans telluris]